MYEQKCQFRILLTLIL